MGPSRSTAALIARPRLLRLLDDVPDTGLTQVVAPAGTGKTALVASWAEGRDVRWLGAGEHHRLLERVLDDQGSQPAVVVLDDAHLASPRTRRLVSRLVTEAPWVSRLVLVGRKELTFPELAADFHAGNTVVHGSDLAFTPDEAKAMVQQLAPAIGVEALAQVVTDAEGWASALVSGARYPGTDVRSALDQLATQVLRALPEDAHQLLSATSDEILIDASTAVALTGDDDSAGTFVRLVEDGLLVPDGQLWRAHPVLRRVVREQSQSGGPRHEQLTAAHARATAALHSPAKVVRHAMLSERSGLLLEALHTHGARLLVPRHQTVLAEALHALPPAVRRGDPTILVLESMFCWLTTRYDDAARLSAAAEVSAQSASTAKPDAKTLDWIAIMALWRSNCGWADPHEAIARARQRLGCRHDRPDLPHAASESMEWTTWLMSGLATAQIRTGDLAEAGLHAGEVIANARLLGNERLLATGLADRSLLELLNGSYQTGAETARSSLEHAGRGGAVNTTQGAGAHLVIAWAAAHELDLIPAHEQLAAAEAEPALQTDPVLTDLVRLLKVKLLSEEGLVEDARRLLAQHSPPLSTEPDFLRRLTVISAAQLAAMTNDFSTLRDQVVTLAELGQHRDAELFGAIALACEGRLDDALDRLDVLLERPRLHPAISASAASVRLGLLVQSRKISRAAELLPDVLNRVAPQRMLQILSAGCIGGAAFMRLLEAEADRPDGHPFAAEAFACLGRYARPVRELGPRVVEDDVDRLTPREQDVLAELSLGGSYGDVAQALFLSENTVKTHLASVYRKLGVDRRVDALRVAREHHLL
jgi:LuxR family maltose regulon positive regulatory protein